MSRGAGAKTGSAHLKAASSARAIPGSPITRMSRGARAQKLDVPVARQQAARVGNTRFADTKDVAGRAARARKNPIRLSQGGKRRARAIPDSPIPRVSRGTRAQKPDLPVSRRQAARASYSRCAHNKDAAQKLDPSVSRRQAACAGKTGSPITRMSRVVQAQKAALPVSRRQRARAGNTRFVHNKDAGRRARAKARSPRLKAAGGGRWQYPVCP